MYLDHIKNVLAVVVFTWATSTAQDLVVPTPHPDQFLNFNLSEDEKYLVSWSAMLSNGNIKVWETSSNRLITTLAGLNGGLFHAVISTLTFKVYGLDRDYNLRVWDLRTGRMEQTLRVNDFSDRILIDEEKNELVVIGTKTIEAFNLHTLELKATRQLRSPSLFSFLFRYKHFRKPNGNLIMAYSDSVFFLDQNLQTTQTLALDKIKKHSKYEMVGYGAKQDIILLKESDKKKLIAMKVNNSSIIWERTITDDNITVFPCGEEGILINQPDEDLLIQFETGRAIPDTILNLKDYNTHQHYATEKYLIDTYEFTNKKEKYVDLKVFDANSLKPIDHQIFSAGKYGIGDGRVSSDHYICSIRSQKLFTYDINSFPFIFRISDSNYNENVFINDELIFFAYHNYRMGATKNIRHMLDGRIFNGYRKDDEYANILVSNESKYIFTQGYRDNKTLLRVEYGKDTFNLATIKEFGLTGSTPQFSAFSTEGRYLVFCTNNQLSIIEASTGELLHSRDFKDIQIYENSTVITASERDLLLSFQGDSAVQVYNYAKRKWNRFKIADQILNILPDTDEGYLITGASTVFKATADFRSITPLLNETDITTVLQDSLTSNTFLCLKDGSIRIINQKTKSIETMRPDNWASEKPARYAVNDDIIRNLSGSKTKMILSEDRNYLLTYYRDRLRIWDLVKKRVHFQFTQDRITEIYFSSVTNLLTLLSYEPYNSNGRSAITYDWKRKTEIFNDDTEIKNAKKSPPSEVASIIAKHISVNVNTGSKSTEQHMNVLDFIKNYVMTEDGTQLLMSFSDVFCHVTLLPKKQLRWLKASGNSFALSGDGTYVISAYSGNQFWLTSTQDGATSAPLEIPEISYIREFESSGNYVLFKTESYISGKREYNVVIYDLTRKEFIIRQKVASQTMDITFSKDKRYVACLTTYVPEKDSAYIFDLKEKRLAYAVGGHYRKTAFSPDNSYVVFTPGTQQKDGAILNIHNGNCIFVSIPPYGVNDGRIDHKYFVKDDLAFELKTGKVIRPKIGFIFHADDTCMYGIGGAGAINVYENKKNNQFAIPFQHQTAFQRSYPTPDRKHVLTLGYDNKIIKWNKTSGDFLEAREVGFDHGRTLYFNTDSTFVILFNDYKGTEYNVSDLTPNISFSSGMESNLNYFLPEGYYFANREDIINYYFNLKGSLYGFRQFDLVLNRPDKVLSHFRFKDQALIASYQNAYEKRCRNLDVDPDRAALDATNLPFVTAEYAANHLAKAKEDRKLRLKVTSAANGNSQLTALKIAVNRNPVFASGFLPLTGQTYEGEHVITLSEGENKIEVSCLNSKGNESLTTTLNIPYHSKTPAEPDVYFIGVGVSTYKDRLKDLKYAAKDIRDVDSALRRIYPKLKATLFVDQNATAEKILQMKHTLRGMHVDDKLIIAISGHGINDGTNFYFADYDCDFTHPEHTGFPFDSLNSLLLNAPARQKLVLIDACNSGLIDRDGSDFEDRLDAAFGPENRANNSFSYQNAFELMQDLFADITTTNGAIIISASRSNEYADEGDDNGIFTSCVLEALEEGNADTNEDKSLTISELKAFVSRRVGERTKNRQRSGARKDSPDYDWELIRY